MGRTSIVLIKFSVSASSSHLHSSSLSGLVATTLRGPMGASETSLEGCKSEEIHEGIVQWNGVLLPRCNGKKIARNWDRLVEAVQLVSRAGGHRRLTNGQTTGHHWQWRGDVKVKGAFDIGGILAREDGSCMDSLALRDWWKTLKSNSRSCFLLCKDYHLHIYGCFLLEVWAGVSHCRAVH